MSTETELLVVSTFTTVQLFEAGAPEMILDKIKTEARAAANNLDISTEIGRRAIASLAYKVARTKSFLDEQGKELVSDLKKKSGAIDATRKKFRDELDALKEEVRKDLTDYEEAEKLRIASHQEALTEIEVSGPYSIANWSSLSLESLGEMLSAVENDTRDWQEFKVRSAGVKALATKQIREAIALKEKHNADQAELLRLRAEVAERERQDRENLIAKQAKEKAEAAALAEIERIKRESLEREKKAQLDKADAEVLIKAAEEKRLAQHKQSFDAMCSFKKIPEQESASRLQQMLSSASVIFSRDWEEFDAEAKMLFAQIKTSLEASIETARQREAEAEKTKAKAIEEAAITAERFRQKTEEKKQRDEQQAREADVAHRRNINATACSALKHFGIDASVAIQVITLIAKGSVPNIKIIY